MERSDLDWEDEFGHLVDPDDEPDESPRLWVEAEWLPETWTHPEVIRPTRAVDRVRSTTAGMMLTGIGLGLRDIVEVPREEAPIEIQADGAPPFPRRVEMSLDPEDPEATVVVWHPQR